MVITYLRSETIYFPEAELYCNEKILWEVGVLISFCYCGGCVPVDFTVLGLILLSMCGGCQGGGPGVGGYLREWIVGGSF